MLPNFQNFISVFCRGTSFINNHLFVKTIFSGLPATGTVSLLPIQSNVGRRFGK